MAESERLYLTVYTTGRLHAAAATGLGVRCPTVKAVSRQPYGVS